MIKHFVWNQISIYNIYNQCAKQVGGSRTKQAIKQTCSLIIFTNTPRPLKKVIFTKALFANITMGSPTITLLCVR